MVVHQPRFFSRPYADFDCAIRSNFNAEDFQARRLNALDGACNVRRCEARFFLFVGINLRRAIG